MEKLLKFSLIITISGIFLLLILSFIEPKETDIEKLINPGINYKIKVKGNITKIRTYEQFSILTLNQKNNSIKILLDKKINLTTGKNIIVVGRLKEYNNKLEIYADKILT